MLSCRPLCSSRTPPYPAASFDRIHSSTSNTLDFSSCSIVAPCVKFVHRTTVTWGKRHMSDIDNYKRVKHHTTLLRVCRHSGVCRPMAFDDVASMQLCSCVRGCVQKPALALRDSPPPPPLAFPGSSLPHNHPNAVSTSPAAPPRPSLLPLTCSRCSHAFPLP